MKLQQPDLAEREKEGLIQQALDQIEKQQKKAQEKESLNVLGEASSTLKGLDQPSGGNQQENSETGGGAAQKNLSQEGQGEGKQSQGRGDDSKGQFNAERNKDMRQGQGLKSEAKEKGKETNPEGRRDGRDNKTQPDTADKDTGKELTGKTRGASQEKLGSSRSEEAPQGAPPAERYYKPGEQGQEGVKGAQYITVKLPEDLIANSPGEGTTTNQSKDARSHPKAPLSNVPLPAHVPDAPTEKQQLPLEYRGILR
jgi:hypothetical protein